MSLFKCGICLDALIISLTRMYVMPINLYLELLEGEACHIIGVHQHIFEKSSMFNSFLSLQNLFSSSGLVNMLVSWSSVPALSIEISHFCWWSLMKWWRTSMCFVLACWTGLLVNLIALSLSQQWHFLELDSKVIQGGLHAKYLCITTTGGYVFGFGGW